MELLDGKAVARRVRSEVREWTERLIDEGTVPGLAVVLVGEHAASQVYVRHKVRDCERVGIESTVHRLPDTATEAEVLAVVERLNRDEGVHGILVQLPLPAQMSTRRILNAVDPRKDVDAFHPVNMGQVMTGRPALAPCTPKGIMRLLRDSGVTLRGKHAVVVGRSRVVGRPMSALLLAADATVTTCHRHTPDTAAFTRLADVLVVAVGLPRLVRRDWVKPGAVVVDVGITRLDDGRLSGDVAFDEVAEVASRLTPVPGGVGPMTRAMLLENTCVVAERSHLDRMAARSSSIR